MKRHVLLLLTLFVGCAHHTVPGPYSALSAPEALTILRNQAAATHTISAQGLITLTKPTGDSIRLDCVLVARNPGNLHLRAWKFNRTVFDLTLTPAGLWLLAPDDPRLRQHMQATKTGTVQFARAWALLTHDFIFSPNLDSQIRGNELRLTRHDPAGKITCAIDRSTLTPLKYSLYDRAGKRQFQLFLSDYALHDQIPYASEISADSRFGRIAIRFRQIQINQPLSPAAFVPSPRAEKMP